MPTTLGLEGVQYTGILKIAIMIFMVLKFIIERSIYSGSAVQ